MLICSSEHPLNKAKHVNTKQLKELKYVSLFQSSTVQAIKATLTEHHIQWQSLQVILVSIKHWSHAVCLGLQPTPSQDCFVCDDPALPTGSCSEQWQQVLGSDCDSGCFRLHVSSVALILLLLSPLPLSQSDTTAVRNCQIHSTHFRNLSCCTFRMTNL